MNFIEAVSTVYRKYAVFSGRARRSEFWYFVLFGTIVSSLLVFLPERANIIGEAIFQLVTFIPSTALSWRRMHDIGKRGVWSLIAYVPVIGFILALIWCCRDSEPGDNEYGPNPKGVKEEPID